MKKVITVTIIVAALTAALYSYLQPQELKRKDISSDFELLPAENIKSVVVLPSFDRTLELVGTKEWFKEAQSNGLMDDFFDYLAFRLNIGGLPSKALKLFHGKLFWDLIGDGALVATYDNGEKIYITHPKEHVQMAWRSILKEGQEFRHSGLLYSKLGQSYISFVGNLFVATTSEPKMWAVLERMTKKMPSMAEQMSPMSGVYAYGMVEGDGVLLRGKIEFKVNENGLTADMRDIDGVIGAPLRTAKPFGKLLLPDGTTTVIGFKKIDFSESEDFLANNFPNYTNSLSENGIKPIFPLLKGKLKLIVAGFTEDYYAVPEFALSMQLSRKGRKAIRDVMGGYISDDQSLLSWGVESNNLILWNEQTLKNMLKSSRGKTVSKRNLIAVIDMDAVSRNIFDYMMHVSRYSEFVSANALRSKVANVVRKMIKGRAVVLMSHPDKNDVRIEFLTSQSAR